MARNRKKLDWGMIMFIVFFLILFLIGTILSIGNVRAYTYNNLTDGTYSYASKNITFYGPGSDGTYYWQGGVTVSSRPIMTSAYMNLTGFLGWNDTYQMTKTDAASSGSWWVSSPATRAYDNDLMTKGECKASGSGSNCILYQNFTNQSAVFNNVRIEESGATGIYIGCGGGATQSVNFSVSAYNYTSASWVSVYSFIAASCTTNYWQTVPEITLNRTNFFPPGQKLKTLHNITTTCISGTCYTQIGDYEERIRYDSFPSNITILLGPYGVPDLLNVYNYSGTLNITNRTNNFAGAINLETNGCTGLDSCQIPVTFTSSTAGILQWSGLTFSSSEFIENAQTYNPTTYETASETFKLNVTYDSTIYTSSTAVLVYNGTNYSSSATISDGSTIFSSNIDIPRINTTSVNNSFYWTVMLTNSTGNYYFNSTINNQTVNKISFGLCNSTALLNVTFINFTIRNAESPYGLLNASFKSNWLVGNSSTPLNFTFEDLTETNSSFAFCISPSNINHTITSIIQYYATGYANNYYYVNNASLDNRSTNITLYLINSSRTTLTEVWARDTAQKPVTDVYFTIQAYDVGTDTYRTVAMAKSGYNGKDIVYLNWYDTLYKFILVKNGSIVQTTSPYKISSTPQAFDILPVNLFPYDKFGTIVYTLNFNNLTNNFVLTYTDPTGLVSSGCLKVLKRGTVNDTLVCNTCETSSSATIYCNIGAYGNGTYIGSFYATGSYSPIDTIVKVIGLSNTVFAALGNLDASFYAFLFGGIVLSLFLITPALGVVGAILGLLGGVALGFQPMDNAIFVVITIVGGVVVWILKR